VKCVTIQRSHVTRHKSHVTRQTPERASWKSRKIAPATVLTRSSLHVSHVTLDESHDTRHTSPVTRLTSHVTRHTSHVTRHNHTSKQLPDGRLRRRVPQQNLKASHMSHVTCHTSSMPYVTAVTCHTASNTPQLHNHHTSNVTRHTTITHQTSHVTQPSCIKHHLRVQVY